MTYLEDIRANDYKHWEDARQVTLTLPRLSETVEIDTDYGFQADTTQARQLFGGVALMTDELMWIIPVAELQGETLQIGDTITELDGTTWRINRVAKVRLDTQWVATAIKNVE